MGKQIVVGYRKLYRHACGKYRGEYYYRYMVTIPKKIIAKHPELKKALEEGKPVKVILEVEE